MSCVLEVHPCVRQATPPRPAAGRATSAAARARRRSLRLPALRRLGLTAGCCGLMYGFVSSGVTPYVQAHRLSQESILVCRQIDTEHRRQAVLEQRIADLQTPDGEQNAARVYGWVLKGEIPISCPHVVSALTQASDAELLAVPVPPRPSLLQRLRHAVEW